jgi:hypothetical protein
MSYEKAIETYHRIYRKVDLQTVLDLWAANTGNLHVYVHSPFCASICRFCYYKGVQFSFETDSDLYERFYGSYLPGVVRPFLPMLEARRASNYFFGGGTPSLMRAETMRRVFGLFPGFRQVRSKTFEIHPAVWSEDQLDVLAEHGFNCCIIGIQSFDEKVLERQRRIHAPFERVAELSRAIRSRGMWLGLDLIYRMDPIDADAIFEQDLDLVGRLEGDVISLQLNYDEIRNQEYTERFFAHVLGSGLSKDYVWEAGEEINLERKKTLKCFRYLKRSVPLDVYATEIFPFTETIDEASKAASFDRGFPSVLGLGSYRNPRKNTFSNLRGPDRTVEYIEVNDDWEPLYFITFDSLSRDFYDECAGKLAVMRKAGPPPPGMKIVLVNKVPVAKENYIFRKTAAGVDFSVAWDRTTPEIQAYIVKLKDLFPHWNWKTS